MAFIRRKYLNEVTTYYDTQHHSYSAHPLTALPSNLQCSQNVAEIAYITALLFQQISGYVEVISKN